jgi:hypothetical protein
MIPSVGAVLCGLILLYTRSICARRALQDTQEHINLDPGIIIDNHKMAVTLDRAAAVFFVLALIGLI